MWDLFVEYESEMSLDLPFDPAMEFLVEFPDIRPTLTRVSGLKNDAISLYRECPTHR